MSKDPFSSVLSSVPEAIRKSQLLLALHDKLSAAPVGSFAFINEFGGLRDIVAPQLAETGKLFPEFTPHDEMLHVSQLFKLADKLFGERVYQHMKACELFLLACALYTHDWGMAAGNDEREFLRGGADPQLIKNTFIPLPDEANRLEAFRNQEGIRPSVQEKFPVLTEAQLRLYVRLTHARRSAARVRAHFVHNASVGEALAHLCEGHWHEFAMLDDAERFPRERLAADESTHLLALALQVRLIDLLHITKDRTPYALWRFVSPADTRSREEWKKHQVLHEVDVVTFPPGRAIRIEGFTEDEEVWSGLQDLRGYCEEQIKGTLEITARHVPERYGLNFVKLDWQVTTGTLRPVDFRFGFDRSAMFRILSDDIYDGDRYVFLRELLQNSIDAVRTRRARQAARPAIGRRRVAQPSFDTTIYFTVEHLAEGDIQVACRDCGIGMDEHIIRNYFTVAGVSYYRSTEFQRQQLGFEPISRFGIGILSCFMVADALEVMTYRDPELGPPMANADRELPGADEHRARRLHLKIPGVERQFIVKDLQEAFEVGTEVRLKVLGRKLSTATEVSNDFDESKEEVSGPANEVPFNRNLEITEYLCRLAGFVEFPIFVEEKRPGDVEPKRTLILHPDRDPEAESAIYDPPPTVHQLSREYPWEQACRPESVTDAKEMMTGHRFEISDLARGQGYEGWVVFPMPKDENLDFSREIPGQITSGGEVIYFRNRWNENLVGRPVYWITSHRYSGLDPKRRSQIAGVYRDGLLLESVELPDLRIYNSPFPLALIRINLPSREDLRPNVARTRCNNPAINWFAPFQEHIEEQIRKAFVPAILREEPKERLYRLGRLAAVFQLRYESMIRLFPLDTLPVLQLAKDSGAKVVEGVFGGDAQFFEMPATEQFRLHQFGRSLYSMLYNTDSKSNLAWWHGPDAIFTASDGLLEGSPLGMALSHIRAVIWNAAVNTGWRFLVPPGKTSVLLSQPILTVFETGRGSAMVQPTQEERLFACDIAMSCPDRLELNHWRSLCEAPPQFTHFNFVCIFPLRFLPPFSDRFANWDGRVNSSHPYGRALIRCLGAIFLAAWKRQLSAHQIQSVNSAFAYINYGPPDKRVPILDFIKPYKQIIELVQEFGLLKGFTPPPDPSEEEMVPLMPSKVKKSESGALEHEEATDENKKPHPFGMLVTEWPLPKRMLEELGCEVGSESDSGTA